MQVLNFRFRQERLLRLGVFFPEHNVVVVRLDDFFVGPHWKSGGNVNVFNGKGVMDQISS